jgi:hypothetical protein
MDEASLFNQPVAAKCDVRAVHEAENHQDIGKGKTLIQ